MTKHHGYGSILPFEESENDGPDELSGEEHFQRGQVKRHRSSFSESLSESLRMVVEASFVSDGLPASVRDYGGTSTMFSEVINISKNLIGGGVLSLSGGIAIFSDSPYAVISAAFWTALMGIIFGYYCFLVARVCRFTHCATYRYVIFDADILGSAILHCSSIALLLYE